LFAERLGGWHRDRTRRANLKYDKLPVWSQNSPEKSWTQCANILYFIKRSGKPAQKSRKEKLARTANLPKKLESLRPRELSAARWLTIHLLPQCLATALSPKAGISPDFPRRAALLPNENCSCKRA